MRATRTVVALLVAVTVACDNDPSDPGGGTIVLSEPVVGGRLVDGTIRADGANVNITLSPGDDANNVPYRAVVGFALSALPAGAQVTSAILNVEQCAVFGTPYVTLGSLIADHIDLTGGLAGEDYSGHTLTADVGTVSPNATLGTKSLDVTPQVAADVSASRAVSGFRLRFSAHDSDANFTADGVTLGLPRDGTACSANHPPALTVTYVR